MNAPSKRMSPGDIAPGQFVTILEWEPIVHEPTGLDFALGGTTTRTVTRDNSWKGDVLYVTAVDLPFLVVDKLVKYDKEYPSPTGYERAINLDTRRVSLMELSTAYVEASLGKSHPVFAHARPA